MDELTVKFSSSKWNVVMAIIGAGQAAGNIVAQELMQQLQGQQVPAVAGSNSAGKIGDGADARN